VALPAIVEFPVQVVDIAVMSGALSSTVNILPAPLMPVKGIKTD
jgi:hypothetical protein